MANAFLQQPRSNLGRLLENFVFMELRRKGLNIEYYRTEDGMEVDFVTTTRSSQRALYQVSLELHSTQMRTREVRALMTAMQETGIKHGTIIRLDTEEQIETNSELIGIVPAWLWAI